MSKHRSFWEVVRCNPEEVCPWAQVLEAVHALSGGTQWLNICAAKQVKNEKHVGLVILGNAP